MAVKWLSRISPPAQIKRYRVLYHIDHQADKCHRNGLVEANGLGRDQPQPFYKSEKGRVAGALLFLYQWI
jgi:hypothetical protein